MGQTLANKLDPRKKYRKPVVSNYRTIAAMSSRKLRDLLLNNCIGESGREYCRQTILDVLAMRGTIEPKNDKEKDYTKEFLTECETMLAQAMPTLLVDPCKALGFDGVAFFDQNYFMKKYNEHNGMAALSYIQEELNTVCESIEFDLANIAARKRAQEDKATLDLLLSELSLTEFE